MGYSDIGLVADSVAVALCVVMALKLGEVVFHGSRTYPLETISDGTPPEDVAREWPVSNWLVPFTRWINPDARPHVFRYRTVLAPLVLASSFVTRPWTSFVVAGTLLLAIWVMVSRSIVDLVKYGSASQAGATARHTPLGDISFGEIDVVSRSRWFVKQAVYYFAAIAFSYAAVFERTQFIYRCVFNCEAFDGLPAGYTFLHFLYFSVVTLATVGFGDISPADMQIVPRLIVASEIATGFLFLTIFLTLVNLTFDGDRDVDRE